MIPKDPDYILPYDLDDDLLDATRADGRPRVRIYPVRQVSVVLGRGSKPGEEVWLDRVQKDGVPLFRRRGGGCSVVLDPGNVIVSLVHPKKGFGGGRKEFAGISDWLIDALSRMGYPTMTQRGISDLTIGERKMGGSCIYRPLGLLYYTTTLLVNPDIERVTRYLRHPPREPDYRHGRSHADFMGTLAAYRPLEVPAFIAELADALSPRSPIDDSSMLVESIALHLE